jgi:hypothetical protein
MLGIRGSLSKELERHPHRSICPRINDRKLAVGRVDEIMNYLAVFTSSLNSIPKAVPKWVLGR